MVMYNCCEENTGVQYTTHYTVKPLNSTKVSGAFGKLCRHLNSADLNSERQYIIHIYIYLVYSIDTICSWFYCLAPNCSVPCKLQCCFRLVSLRARTQQHRSRCNDLMGEAVVCPGCPRAINTSHRSHGLHQSDHACSVLNNCSLLTPRHGGIII